MNGGEFNFPATFKGLKGCLNSANVFQRETPLRTIGLGPYWGEKWGINEINK